VGIIFVQEIKLGKIISTDINGCWISSLKASRKGREDAKNTIERAISQSAGPRE